MTAPTTARPASIATSTTSNANSLATAVRQMEGVAALLDLVEWTVQNHSVAPSPMDEIELQEEESRNVSVKRGGRASTATSVKRMMLVIL